MLPSIELTIPGPVSDNGNCSKATGTDGVRNMLMQIPDSRPIQPAPPASIPQLKEEVTPPVPQEADRESEQVDTRETQGLRSITTMKALSLNQGHGDTADTQTRTSSAPTVLTIASTVNKVRFWMECVHYSYVQLSPMFSLFQKENQWTAFNCTILQQADVAQKC